MREAAVVSLGGLEIETTALSHCERLTYTQEIIGLESRHLH